MIASRDCVCNCDCNCGDRSATTAIVYVCVCIYVPVYTLYVQKMRSPNCSSPMLRCTAILWVYHVRGCTFVHFNTLSLKSDLKRDVGSRSFQFTFSLHASTTTKKKLTFEIIIFLFTKYTLLAFLITV